MVYISLLLLLVYPLFIRGDGSNGREFRTEDNLKKDRAIDKFISLFQGEKDFVRSLAQNVRGDGEMIQYQQRNIKDLRKSLAEVSDKMQDLDRQKKETYGSSMILAELRELKENMARQEDKIDQALNVLRDLHGDAYKAENCAAIAGGNVQGVYHLYPDGVHPVSAFCNKSAGGGWTVIQKRFDGSVDFYRGWEEYAKGFGDPAGEYWLGLQHIHTLTKEHPMDLYVGLTDFDRGPLHAKYSSFSVSSEEDKFRLHIGNFSGNVSDSLVYHNDKPFSTKDQDNDANPRLGLSHFFHGAWWYYKGANSNLNGRFSTVKDDGGESMFWRVKLHNNKPAMKTSIMMIRPSNFKP